MITEKELDAIEMALESFHYFSDEPYEADDSSRLEREWREVSEALVGESLVRLRQPFLELKKLADADGLVVFNGVNVKFSDVPPRRHGETPIINATVYEGEIPKYLFELVETPSKIKGNSPVLNFIVSQIEAERRDYPYAEQIGSTKILDKEGRNPVSFGHSSIMDFKKFVSAMTFAKPILALAPYEMDINEQSIAFYKLEKYLPLLELDGGLVGTNALRTATFIQNFTFSKILEWAKEALPATYNAEKDRGFVWGEKFLRWNDYDDRSCAIVTNDERIAVFHQNISFIAPHDTYIASMTMEDGEVSRFDFYSLDRSSVNIIKTVEDYKAGRLADPVVSHDFKTKEISVPAGIEETGLFNHFGFLLECDRELFVDGVMDSEKRTDCEVQTDFVDEFGPPEDEFEDDEGCKP